MKTILLVVVFFTFGCSTTNPQKNEVIERGPLFTISKNDTLLVNGNQFFVTQKTKDFSLSTYQKTLKDFLSFKGFELTDSETKAQLLVQIYQRYLPVIGQSNNEEESEFDPEVEQSASQQSYVSNNGKSEWRTWTSIGKGTHYLALIIDVFQQEYGKRPKPIFNFIIQDFSDNWKSENEAIIINKFQSELNKIDIRFKKVQNDNKKLPGCMPRFGYELAQKIENKKIKEVVDSVLPKSPAEKAGLKKGDRILAIDSIPLSQFSGNESEEIYLQKKSVPIKFERNGKILRGTIQSQIICERI